MTPETLSAEVLNAVSTGFQTSPTTKEIIPAFVKAQVGFMAVAKSHTNREQGFSFASLEDYFEVIRGPLGDNGLAIAVDILEVKPVVGRTTKSGTPWNVNIVKIRQRLWHSSGEWIDFICYGEGQDSGDKSIYKAITGARKYGLTLLGLATTDDPDSDGSSDGRGGSTAQRQQYQRPQHRQQTPPPTEQRTTSSASSTARSATSTAPKNPGKNDFIMAIPKAEKKCQELGVKGFETQEKIEEFRFGSLGNADLNAVEEAELKEYYSTLKQIVTRMTDPVKSEDPKPEAKTEEVPA